MPADNPIYVDNYVVPIYAAATGSEDPMKQLWSPTSITLIHTEESALVCDVPTTVVEAEKLADWIDRTIQGKKVKYFWTTHAHGDHFFGLPVLQRRYPGIKAVATAKVVEGVHQQYDPALYDALWSQLFPGQLSEEKPVPEALPASGELDLDGHTLRVFDAIEGDSGANSYLHVPQLDLVVAGDLVYGECYQYLAEANTKDKRRGWIETVERIEALKPKIVVPGHKRATQIDGVYLCAPTKRYILDFEEALEKSSSAKDLYDRMKQLYPQRWNDFILERSCEASFANKGL